MDTEQFDQYLQQANEAAQSANWPATIQALQAAGNLQPDHVGVITSLGSCYIQLGQPQTALPYFEKVAKQVPDSTEALNNLGIVQAMLGNYAQAEQAYRQAISLDSEHKASWKNLAQLCIQQNERLAEGVQILASLVRSHPEDVEVLVTLGQCYETAEEWDSAEVLFQRALEVDSAFTPANDGLARIKKARPAAVNLDRIARPEHAKKLAALKNLRKPAAPVEPGTSQTPPQQPAFTPLGPFTEAMADVTIVAIENTHAYLQAGLLIRKLSETGRSARIRGHFESADIARSTTLVFSQPNLSGDFIKAINDCIQAGKPYGVMIDYDYHRIPADHPAYKQLGAGNPGSLKALDVILGEAQFVIVPSKVLAERYRGASKTIEVLPPGWDAQNPLWKRPLQKHTGLHYGWIGTEADRVDLLSIKKAILGFRRQKPEATLAIAGDMGAYGGFNAVDESRRVFLPTADPEEEAYILGQFDILIVPQRSNPYNQARSFLPLMEAAARGIPWIASPIPAFEEWGAGGILASTPDEWMKAFSKMTNAEVRQRYVEEGRARLLR